MSEVERGNRKFWQFEDVTTWIHDNDPAAAPSDLRQAAIWWVCYRNAEAMMESTTTKELARDLNNGLAAIDEENDVTDHLQNWTDEAGDEGDKPGIDDAIEADLRNFFLEGR